MSGPCSAHQHHDPTCPRCYEIVDIRHIPTPDGILEVQLTQEGIDRMRQHFGLFGEQRLEDDQIRMYVFGAFNTAVTKAEQEIKDDKPTTVAPRVRRTRRRKKSQGS